MRLSAPLYDGDSIIRPGPSAQTAPSEPLVEAEVGRGIVRRSMDAIDTVTMDPWTIERRAKVLRAAFIRSLFKSFYDRLSRWFDRREMAEREEYLAASQNLAELEARMRRLERRGLSTVGGL